jgi:hypothetical protein
MSGTPIAKIMHTFPPSTKEYTSASQVMLDPLQSDVYSSAKVKEQIRGGAISRPSQSRDVRNTEDKPPCREIINIGLSLDVFSFLILSDNDFQPLGSHLI